MIRTIWFDLNLLVSTTLLGLVTIVGGLFRMGRDVGWWTSRNWSRWLVWASGCKVTVEGLHNVAMDRPQVFIANHVSHVDVIAVAANIPKRFRFVAKKELGRIPLFGTAWKVAGHISVDRGDRASAVASLDAAGRLIREDNSSVVIFAEGTRSMTGELQPFKKGAFMLALRTGVEIVPIAILGTRRILPKGASIMRPGPVLVRFGPPIDTRPYDESSRDALMERVRAAIEELLQAPVGAPSPRP